MNPHERRLPGELVFVLVAVLFALTALWQAYRISGFASWSSPGAVPMFAALVMVLSGLKIAVGTWRRPPPANVPGVSRAAAFAQALFPRVVVLFMLLIVLYMFALEPAGFVVASFLFLVAGTGVLCSRRWGYNAVVSAVSLAVIYVIFQTAFSVVLPEGVLKGLL